jgi:peptidyl-dipeptidase A
MFVRPPGRDVVCHASAWDVTYSNDLRIKMCIETKENDLITIHHELGHDYYSHYFYTLPVLFQKGGANEGFNEAIGDAVALSVTPGYLQKVGLLDSVPSDEKGRIDVLFKAALDRVAFLPFGKLIDQWRWDVFSGKTPPANYNAHWWELKRKYQGVAPPVERSEADFDPGAKYHIAANVPYLRYFLARILQFQFHRALCRAAGFKGPLDQCSVYGSKAAGERLRALLAIGASKPWPDALAAIGDERAFDAGALLEYFAPLAAWLEKENAGRQCGW